MPKPTMILLAGINGAGKTTFYYNKIKPYLESKSESIPFVNADELEKANHPDERGQHSYAAARQAARLRDIFLKTGQSFVTETVFSHRSKIDLIAQAQEHGFKVLLNHVHVDRPDKAFLRIKTRIAMGGHAVPENKVHERFPRTVSNLKDAVKFADFSYIWDNNRGVKLDQASHRFVMAMEKGVIIKLSSNVPEWAKDMYSEQINYFNKKA